MKAFLRGTVATLVGSMGVLFASNALAVGEACFVDTDCPGTACGDAVCNWTTAATVSDGRKVFGCNPAGTQAAAMDGWCETTADCKCKGEGATCVYPYCTFTKPMGGAGGSGAGGSGAGGAAAGSSSTAGTSSVAGTSSAAGTGSTPPASSDDGGGCSVSAPGVANTGLAVGVAVLGLGLAFARRRR